MMPAGAAANGTTTAPQMHSAPDGKLWDTSRGEPFSAGPFP